MGRVVGAAVDQGCNIVGKLQGGELAVLLTDGNGQGAARLPFGLFLLV